MRQSDHSYKVARPNSYGVHRHNGWEAGAIATTLGFVEVYMQGDSTSRPATILRFIHGGRCYVRSLEKRYTRRGVVAVAVRFAAEVSGL